MARRRRHKKQKSLQSPSAESNDPAAQTGTRSLSPGVPGPHNFLIIRSEEMESYLVLSPQAMFTLADTVQPKNFKLIEHIFNKDHFKIPLDRSAKEYLLNLYISNNREKIGNMMVDTPNELAPSTPQHPLVIIEPSEIPTEKKTNLVNKLSHEFPEFGREAIEIGLLSCDYDLSRAKKLLAEQDYSTIKVVGAKKPPKDPPSAPCQINERKLEPHMIKSDVYRLSSRRTRSELIGNTHQDPIARKETIDQHLIWSAEFREKAAEARSKKNYSLLSYYSIMRQSHLEAARDYLDEEFFDEFWKRYEIALKIGSFDLHGFSIKESIESLKYILNPTENDLPVIPHAFLDIITGRGAHSSNNNARIKPKISSLLTKSGIKFSQINPGCVRLDLLSFKSS